MIKKSFLASVLSVSMLIGLFPSVSFAASGEGTATDPYLVSTVSDLLNIRNDLTACYKLTADIDMNGIAFTPIGNENDGAFSGTLDGDGHKIKNLTAGDENTKYAGLIGYLEGTVKNLTLENVNVNGYRYVGGIAGYAGESTIQNCIVSGAIKTTYQMIDTFAGGITGYSNGSIKNCKNYSDISNYSQVNYAYIGGVTSYCNNGEIINCDNSGDLYIENEDMNSYAGGIVSFCNGKVFHSNNRGNIVLKDTGYNGGDSYAGGIVGYLINGSIELDNCINDSTIHCERYKSFSCAGGIVSYSENSDLVLTNVKNSGEVTGIQSYSGSWQNNFVTVGGLVGKYSNGEVNIENCSNKAVLNAKANSTDGGSALLGGIIGEINSAIVNIKNSFNLADLVPYDGDGYQLAGGLVASANSSAKITIVNCYNAGDISACLPGGIVGMISGDTILDIKGCMNVGNVYSNSTFSTGSWTQGYRGHSYSGGIFSGVNPNHSVKDNQIAIKQCINAGIITSRIADYTRTVGISPYGVISECYNVGYLNGQEGTINGISPNFENSYQLIDTYNDTVLVPDKLLTMTQFKMKDSFDKWDYENIWELNENKNSGFPSLKNLPDRIVLNEIIKVMEPNDTEKLVASYNDQAIDVKWKSDNENIATIDAKGNLKALNVGTTTITAIATNGLIAKCSVYIYKATFNMEFDENLLNISQGNTYTLYPIKIPTDATENMMWFSDNESVAIVDQNGTVTAVSKGTATITATTVTGNISASCIVQVTSPVQSISLSSTSATLNINQTKRLTATISPVDYSGMIEWRTTNSKVATVDQEGLITATGPGTAIISVTADSGKTAQCTVTVKSPATDITLNKTELTLEKGYTEKLICSMLPADTTDTVTWSTSSSTYAAVNSDGTVTANRTGTATITATTTSGKKAYCVVTIVDPTIPVASVTVDRTEHIMTQAETVQLKGVILPSDATNKNLTWTSTDNRIASVTENGVVTANAVGVAVITATANNGMYGQCVIKVISASGPSVILSGEAAIPNSTAHVKASIVNNPGISGYAFTINYDESLLTPVSITPNSAFEGSFTTNLNDAERTDLNVIWYSNSDKDIDVNGELFAVEFKVRDTAEYGDYSDISIVYGARDICNTAGEFIALYTQNTTVQVAEPMPGDIYEDGDVNIYDLTLLARYITGLEIFTDRQINAANVTDDEIVDIKDVVTLAQYLVGWSGAELMAADVYSNNNSASPVIKVGSASVNESGEAEIPVSIAGNPGVAGYRFHLDYNAEDIEIISITPSELINENNFNTNLGAESESTEGLLVSCYQESNATVDGVLFTIKVRYKNPSDSLVSPFSIREAENNMCGENKEYVAADYETGYVLGDDYIVANTVVEDTKFTCELYFDASYKAQSAVALLAFYDNNGRLVQIRKEGVDIRPGKVDLDIDYEKKAYDTYKLMIWEDTGTLRPLVSVKQYGG